MSISDVYHGSTPRYWSYMPNPSWHFQSIRGHRELCTHYLGLNFGLSNIKITPVDKWGRIVIALINRTRIKEVGISASSDRRNGWTTWKRMSTRGKWV